jgi:hypothetical protein
VLITIALGIGVGLILGLTGAGGSIVAVPLLMAGLGWTLPQASPVALLAVCSAALVGTVEAWRKGLVRYRAATLMSATGALTTPLGIYAAQALPIRTLTLIFAAVLIYIAARMFRQAARAPLEAGVVRSDLSGDAGEAVCRLHPETGRIRWTSPCAAVLALMGVMAGFVSGLLGVGGGFIIVPALRKATELTMHGAVATSLMIITLVSGGAVVSGLLQHRPMPIEVALPFVAGSVLGMVLGRWLAPHLSGAKLQKSFAIFLVVASGGMALHAIS